MKEKIYIKSDFLENNFFLSVLSEYDFIVLKDKHFYDNNFKNNNVIIVNNNNLITQDNVSFYLNNNVILLISKIKKFASEYNLDEINIYYGPIKIKKFTEIIKASFFSKKLFLKDVIISNERLSNVVSGSSCNLTLLEKKILTEFVKSQKIKRDVFLEKIFQIKKDIETKTLESHLTRIRKKLIKIDSKIKISSKEDTFYLDI